MENQRLYLFIALSIVIMLLFNSWQEQYGPKPVPVSTQDVPASGQPVDNSTTAEVNKDLPASSIEQPVEANVANPPMPTTIASNAAEYATGVSKRLHVVTDLLDVEIDSKGGDIRRASLLAYPKHLAQPDEPFILFDDRLPNLMIYQAGLLSKQGPAVNHRAVFNVDRTNYQMDANEKTIDVALNWQSGNGFKVTKTLSFNRDSYLINIKYDIENNTGKDWTGSFYRQIQRTSPSDEDQSRFVYTYTGGVVSSLENKYQKVKFDEMSEWKPEASYTKGGWVAMIQHYFLGAVIPGQDELNHAYTKVVDQSRYIVGMRTADFSVANGQSKQVSTQLYIGPKVQSLLDKAAPNLRLTVDFGMLTILAQPIFWLLNKIHSYLGNWGFAIIFVTLIVKLIFFKLSESAYRSMANMRKFQPKIQALKERYGNDKQRMSQAMMDLYKKEKINPLGGCLPMLVQIPVFISLYWVLLESVELRQADFMLWINDLSAKDPYYVLPLIMGVSMFIQQKLNPAPMDPMQQKILSFLPIIFTVFFAFFPSGLVLYWVVNNVLSITQQWYITRKIERASSA